MDISSDVAELEHNIDVVNSDSPLVVSVAKPIINLEENCDKSTDPVANLVTNSVKTLKRRDLSIKEKQDVLERYDALPKCSQREAASKLGISQSALCNLLKQRDRIDKEMLSNGNGSRKRKRDGKCKSVETALWEWFKSARLRNTPISREVLMEKATEFAIMLDEEFSATDGWLTRWKERYNVKHRLQRPEKDENRSMFEEGAKSILSQTLRGYEPRQIFSADETALFYRALPEHADMLKNGETSSREYDKATKRITVLLACSQDGAIRKTPVVVGGDKNPASLRGIKNLPLRYCCNKYALVTSDIFSDYLTKWDEELKGEKIVLLLEKCAAHPCDVPLKNIKLVFLTADSGGSVLHPLRQGVVRSFKCHYRRGVAKRVIDAVVEIDAIARSVSLLDAMHMINEAWMAVGSKTVKDGFEKCGLSLGGESPDVAGAPEWGNRNESFLEYVAIDEDLQTTCENSEEDIVDMIRERRGCDVEYESGSDSEEDAQGAPPSVSEAWKALRVLRRTLELKGAGAEDYRVFYALKSNVERLLTGEGEKSWADNFFVKLH